MSGRGRLALLVVVAFFAAIVGVVVGRLVVSPPQPAGHELHHLLHEELDLDAGQRRGLDALEIRFEAQRRALEYEIRADNSRLAEAIEAEHANGPRVTAAVDASHRALGRLQKATLAHVFAMRRLLRPDQTAKFDRAIMRALTDERR